MIWPDPSKPAQEQDPDILGALTIFGEARGESYLGKVAIAHVILNRMAKHGKSVADTVLAPKQFSCWNEDDPNREQLENIIAGSAKNVSLALWATCVGAWQGSQVGTEPDPTGGATHYVTVNLWNINDLDKRPRWYGESAIEAGETRELARIGNHVFAEAA